MRTLSTWQTFLAKFIVLPLALIGWGTFLFPKPDGLSWPPILFIMALGMLALYFNGIRLKRVRLDHNDLLISNFVREVRVPLKSVTRVSGGRFSDILKVEFDPPTPFGRSIVFFPKAKLRWPFQEHPIAKELRELVRSAHQSAD